MPEKPGEDTPQRKTFRDVFHRLRKSILVGSGADTQQAAIQAQIQRRMVQGGRKIGGLKEISTEFVRNPDRGIDFDRRHNNLLITQKVIEVLIRQNREEIDAMVEEVSNAGGFLMQYAGEGRERLNDVYRFDHPTKGGWLMAETSAMPVDGDGMALSNERILGADGQFYISPDDETATADPFPLLIQGKDALLDGMMVSEEIRNHPQIAMLVGDISSVRAWNGYGFAAATEDAAFRRVITEINTVRTHTIKYVLAAIASVKGVMDRKKTLLAPALSPEGMRNYRSMILHLMRKSATGLLLGKQLHREVPVELPAGDRGSLLVDWYVTAQYLDKIRIRDGITIYDEDMSQPHTA